MDPKKSTPGKPPDSPAEKSVPQDTAAEQSELFGLEATADLQSISIPLELYTGTPQLEVTEPSAAKAEASPAALKPPTQKPAPARDAGTAKPAVVEPAQAKAAAPAKPPSVPVPPPIVTAVWKIEEPKDQSDPVPHEQSEFCARGATWNLMAASLRGRLHAHKAMWREDAYALGWVQGWTIIALSDGAGSARLARVGARVACAAALESLKTELAGYRLSQGTADVPTQEEQNHLRLVLTQGALAARNAVILEAKKRQCTVRDMNATFLLMFHTPFNGIALVGALQVGDGAIGIYTEDDVCHVLGAADHGQYSSETRFLTDAGIDLQFGQRVELRSFKKAIRGMAVMCDGVSDDFFPERKRLLELFSGNPIQELKTPKGEPLWGVMHKDKGIVKNPQGGKALLDWLRYEKRGSSDDRTLVLMYRSETT